MKRFVLLALGLLAFTSTLLARAEKEAAPKPLFRDPVFDGAADPVVVWNPHARAWWMFYTNRRANVPGLSGVAWVHGTAIGIAESRDGGETWTYVGTADIALPPEVAGPSESATLWAPEVVPAATPGNPIGYPHPAPSTNHGTEAHGPSNPIGDSAAGTHHMFLTVVPGVFEDWKHPRRIVHLTSADLRHWAYRSTLALSSDRVIDAGVHRLPNGTWRLWYNNERDGKSIYYADSPDLATWTDRGKCTGVGERPGEGPFVFRWRGRHWMLVDLWRGLGVYRSDDFEHWTAQADNLLAQPGRGVDDGVNGGHPCVVVSGDRAFLFYFTHPGRAGTIKPEDKDSLELRRSSIQVVELREKDGVLSCDRDAPTYIDLAPPTDSVAWPNPLITQRADPHIFRHTDGWYYFMGTVPEYDRLELRRARTIEDLAAAEPKTIWRKHAAGPMGAHIWAPELHFIDGKWFIYFAAGAAEKVWNIRVYVLENSAANPLEGEWVERGQLDTGWQSFALDATTFAHRGRRYLVWAQKGIGEKDNSNLYLAPMASPTQLAGPPVLLSRPEFPWERVRYAVNEGPAVLVRHGRIFITYSAAGTGAEYCLGLLSADENADLLDPKSWTKSPTPVFTTSEATGIFGPGHNSFTTDTDGSDLLVFHARNYRDIVGDPLKDPNRQTRVQRIAWRVDGAPDFGTPAPETR